MKHVADQPPSSAISALGLEDHLHLKVVIGYSMIVEFGLHDLENCEHREIACKLMTLQLDWAASQSSHQQVLILFARHISSSALYLTVRQATLGANLDCRSRIRPISL